MEFVNGKAFKTHDEANSVCATLTNMFNTEYTVVRKTTSEKPVYKVCPISGYNYDVKQAGWVISDE